MKKYQIIYITKLDLSAQILYFFNFHIRYARHLIAIIKLDTLEAKTFTFSSLRCHVVSSPLKNFRKLN